jgi:hypothetical protein
VESQKKRANKQNLNVGEKVILKHILEIQIGVLWTGFIWFRIETSGGLF